MADCPINNSTGDIRKKIPISTNARITGRLCIIKINNDVGK